MHYSVHTCPSDCGYVTNILATQLMYISGFHIGGGEGGYPPLDFWTLIVCKLGGDLNVYRLAEEVGTPHVRGHAL